MIEEIGTSVQSMVHLIPTSSDSELYKHVIPTLPDLELYKNGPGAMHPCEEIFATKTDTNHYNVGSFARSVPSILSRSNLLLSSGQESRDVEEKLTGGFAC